MREELISKLIDLIKVKFFINEVLPTHKLREDLGLDSIGLMMLSLSLEEEFNFQFEDAVMFLTVQDVVSFLEKHGK